VMPSGSRGQKKGRGGTIRTGGKTSTTGDFKQVRGDQNNTSTERGKLFFTSTEKKKAKTKQTEETGFAGCVLQKRA